MAELFTIMTGGHKFRELLDEARAAGETELVVALPWEMMAPHEKQADSNHGQTLRRLDQRGGLGACEAVAVLEDREWRPMTYAAANKRLKELLAEWRTCR